jgi:Cu2+-exporting ATPase
MHPRVLQDKPGTCPICGMTLVLQKQNKNAMVSEHQHGTSASMGIAGHNHHTMIIADFKKRFYVVLVLTVLIMLLSMMIQQFIGMDWQFTGSISIDAYRVINLCSRKG